MIMTQSHGSVSFFSFRVHFYSVHKDSQDMSYKGTLKDFLHNYHIQENVEQIKISLPFKTVTVPDKIKKTSQIKIEEYL